MLDASKEVLSLSAGKTRKDIETERLLNLGLVRLIGIVGEAAAKVSAEGQSEYRNIPWPQIIGMRNRLIHGYDNIDFDILFKTISEDLPPLVAELERVIQTAQK
ncbi:MAG: HepT-like ribonuclease domain-containing protein [Deltaproteobacteria bacterium]